MNGTSERTCLPLTQMPPMRARMLSPASWILCSLYTQLFVSAKEMRCMSARPLQASEKGWSTVCSRNKLA